MQAANVQQMIQNIRNPYVGPARAAAADRRGPAAGSDPGARTCRRTRSWRRGCESYEIAFRMQTEATDAFDLNKEPPEVHAAYGATPTGRQLLVARRLVERGVRSCRCWHDGWDHHQDLQERLHEEGARDRPAARGPDGGSQAAGHARFHAGRLGRRIRPQADQGPQRLRQSRPGPQQPGLLDLDGRRRRQGRRDPRRHRSSSARRRSKDPADIHDLHATILACLGFDHTKLTYRFNGRDFRLTDVAGNVIRPILA